MLQKVQYIFNIITSYECVDSIQIIRINSKNTSNAEIWTMYLLVPTLSVYQLSYRALVRTPRHENKFNCKKMYLVYSDLMIFLD